MPDSSAVDDDRMLHTMASCIATLHDFIADRSKVGVCHIDAHPVIWYKEEEAGVYETLPISTGIKSADSDQYVYIYIYICSKPLII